MSNIRPWTNGDQVALETGYVPVNVKGIDGTVSTVNSSTTVLDPAGVNVFTGTAEEITNFGIIYVTVKTDVVSATDGLSIQQSSDGINWDHTDEFTVPAATGKTYSFQAGAKYFRVVYTNGAVIQTYFRLQTLFKSTNGKPSSHRLKDDITSDDDAELTTTVLKVLSSDETTFSNADGVHPLSVNSDSLYVSDIDSSSSDNGGFSGVVTDYFDDLHSVNTDASATNPKTIKIWFKHSIQFYSMGFGCDTTGKSFSNIKIEIFGSDEFIRETIDDSANNTKYTSKAYDFAPSKANGVIITFNTADEINLSNIIIWKSSNTNARLSAISDLTGGVEDIRSFKGALNVHQSDVHNFMVNTNFHQHDTATTTVDTATIAGATAQIVADTTGFTVGDKVEITSGAVRENNGAIITIIAAGAPGTLTYDRPLDNPYPIGAGVERIVSDLAAGVLGTLAAPLSFIVAPPSDEVWHVQRILLSAVYPTSADDGDFGDGAALTNGLVLRQNLSTGLDTISVWKTNGEMKLDFFDLPYTDKAPAGAFGMNGRFTNKKVDVTYALNGADGDYLEILRQDIITLTSLEFKAQGHKANQ